LPPDQNASQYTTPLSNRQFKALALHYGGTRFYRRTVPFFLGWRWDTPRRRGSLAVWSGRTAARRPGGAGYEVFFDYRCYRAAFGKGRQAEQAEEEDGDAIRESDRGGVTEEE